MNKDKMSLKKYIKLSLLAVVIIISIKPVLFTWNLIQTNFHLEKNKFTAGAYMERKEGTGPKAFFRKSGEPGEKVI